MFAGCGLNVESVSVRLEPFCSIAPLLFANYHRDFSSPIMDHGFEIVDINDTDASTQMPRCPENRHMTVAKKWKKLANILAVIKISRTQWNVLGSWLQDFTEIDTEKNRAAREKKKTRKKLTD